MHDEADYCECSQCGCLTMDIYYCEHCEAPLCDDCVRDTGPPKMRMFCENCFGKIIQEDKKSA